MKNTNFLNLVKCIIKECDTTDTNEIHEEENQSAESVTEEGFHPFDIDQIFAN